MTEYPEYKQASWNFPEGDLKVDQRHRARLWATYGIPRMKGLIVSALETLESGVPYGASNLNTTGNFNGVNPRPFVTGAPGLRESTVGRQHDLLLHASRRVQDRGSEADGFGDQLQPRHRRGSTSEHPAVLRPGAGHQPVQRVPAVRMRRNGLPEWRRDDPDAHRHDDADLGNDARQVRVRSTRSRPRLSRV